MENDKYFPVLILIRGEGDTQFRLAEAEAMPVDKPFEIIAPNATPEMKALAVKMYNKGWTDHENVVED